MSQQIDDYCRGVADEMEQLTDAGRLSRIYSVCDRAAAEGQPVMPIVLGIILRDRGRFEWAESVFHAARRVPGARHMALFEQAVADAWLGRPELAVNLLEEAEALAPLNAYQQRVTAQALGRVGRAAEAAARLDRSYELEPGSERECVELLQLIEFQLRFPFDEAVARAEALLNHFDFRTVGEVVDDAMAAVREGRPYAMIRMNDGEGAMIRLSTEDESAFSALYARNRREMHNIWFGDERVMTDPDYAAAMAEFDRGLANMDCLAGDMRTHLRIMYPRGVIRHIPSLFNIVRKLEQVRDAAPDRRIALSDPHFHQMALFSGDLDRLLEAQERIGLVACYPALPDALCRRFGLKEVFLHQTPGETAARRPGHEPEPFGVWHKRLSDDLRANVRPGVLYLVAAGITGNIYCDLIKQGGGVALDIGSVADIWARVPTRNFESRAENFGLMPAGA